MQKNDFVLKNYCIPQVSHIFTKLFQPKKLHSVRIGRLSVAATEPYKNTLHACLFLFENETSVYSRLFDVTVIAIIMFGDVQIRGINLDRRRSGSLSTILASFPLLVTVITILWLAYFNFQHVSANSNLQLIDDSSLLSSNPMCAKEFKLLCGNTLDKLEPSQRDVLQENLAILGCISDIDNIEERLTSQCQHQIWSFKLNITNTNHFTSITKTLCKSLLMTNRDCLEAENEDALSSGVNILSCLMDRVQPDTNFGCKAYLKEMQLIIFSDYRLINKFTKVCEKSVKQFQCGRLENWADEKSLHSQTNTVACLQKVVDELPPECKHEILRISELQSDDFHLDRPLYFKCRADRETFCKNVPSGKGRVYRCLMQHKQDSDMSEDCRDKLTQREILTIQDYKISKNLVLTCKSDIKRYQCREGTSERREIRLAQILICLESAYIKNLPISTSCYGEMLLHRRSLFDEHTLTPKLVSACQEDIDEFCSNYNSAGGKILHCLMNYSKPKRRRGDEQFKKRKQISSNCQKELENLLKEINVAENWRVDPVLQVACQRSVDTLCGNVKAGNGRVIDCLIEHIDSSFIPIKCREAVLQVEYFMVRNFELDVQIYEACYSDSVKYCNAEKSWHHKQEATKSEGSTVMACLYRHVYHDESVPLSKNCIQHVKRVMQQRSDQLSLLPFIEIECTEDLSMLCSDKIGHEMECLQNNYDQLRPSCRISIGNFTEAQSKHFELNVSILKSCSTVTKELCPEFENYYDDNQGEIIDCLIRNKNAFQMRQNRACKAAIEHFQLTNMKDFRFDINFREACKQDVIIYCDKVHTKNEVVNCLSALVYNDTITSRRRVSKKCKNHLRSELLQMNEDIDLDPILTESCRFDRSQFCNDIDSGESRVIECLMNNLIRLKKSCQRQLYRRQYIELLDNSVDYALLSTCKHAIDKHCSTSDLHDVLYCLRDHRRTVSPNCRSVILKRLLQQNKDYRLNPRLKSACTKEINRYCSDIIIKRKSEELLDGKIILCLKKKYLFNLLSQSCEVEVVSIIRETSLDIELDPTLVSKCQTELHRCEDSTDIEECLKSRFVNKKIVNMSCKLEVARIIRESEADIESDPHLFRACAIDLRTHCGDVTSGGGHRLNCLTTIGRSSPTSLSTECSTLLQLRIKLFEYAAEIHYPTDDMAQMIALVANSPMHNSVYSMLGTLLLFFFFVGIFCGRFTKQVATSDKIK